jgi:hypothetical protein
MHIQFPARIGPTLLLPIFLVAGCSDQSNAVVTGMVRVDGVPVEKGAITFIPKDGQSATSGGEIVDGKYSVHVPVGKMKVSISMPKQDKKKKLYPTADSPEMWTYIEGLPARYNDKTELELDVKSGTNNKDWDLQKK